MSMKIDMVNNCIFISRAFYEESQEYGSEAYTRLQLAKMENPNMKVIVQTTRRGNRANANKGLTYDYMRRFIRTMDRDNLYTFDEVIEHYEDFGQTGGELYNNVKEWFLMTYPRHREMIVETVPQKVA
ncbi:MAG: hypothetical protein J6C06_11060 [Lachnospiraceae bacterium]|nr:hypothetical protein [Lachnospiraceae bacterium]